MAVGATGVIIPNRLEMGAAYSTPLYTENDLNFNGLTLKMVLRY